MILIVTVGLLLSLSMTVIMATAPRGRHDDLWMAWGVGVVTALSSVALFLLVTHA